MRKNNKGNKEFKTKSPSLLNLGYKSMCPPLHDLAPDISVPPTRFSLINQYLPFTTQKGCCIYNPKRQTKQAENLFKAAKGLSEFTDSDGVKRNIWKKDDARNHLLNLRKMTLDTILAIDAQIDQNTKAVHLGIGREKVIAELNIASLSARRAEIIALQLNGNSLKLSRGEKSEALQAWQLAEKEFQEWKQAKHSRRSRSEEDFIDEIRMELVYNIEILIKKYLYSAIQSEEDKKSKLNVAAWLYSAKDALLGIVIWSLKNPVMRMWVAEVMLELKNELCSKLQMQRLQFEISDQSSTMESATDIINFAWMTTASFLSDSQNAKKVASFLTNMINISISSSVVLPLNIGPLVSALFSFIASSVERTLSVTIKTVMTKYVEQKGMNAIFEFFNVYSCIHGAVHLKNASITMKPNPNIFWLKLKFMTSAIDSNKLSSLPPMVVKYENSEVNMNVRGGWVDAALSYLIIQAWNESERDDDNKLDVFTLINNLNKAQEKVVLALAQSFLKDASFMTTLIQRLTNYKSSLHSMFYSSSTSNIFNVLFPTYQLAIPDTQLAIPDTLTLSKTLIPDVFGLTIEALGAKGSDAKREEFMKNILSEENTWVVMYKNQLYKDEL